MRLFIDTANINDIRTAYELGVIEGVTTNPSIIAKEGKKFEDAIKEIVNIVGDDTYIFGEVISLEADGMVKEAHEIVKLHKKIIVKIPMCAEGLKAVSRLAKEGIKTCVTLCFSAGQALMASRAGASFVAPFLGRLDDIGWDGLSLVTEIAEMFAMQNDMEGEVRTQIVAASTRNPIHVIGLAKAGCDIATVPYNVIKQMIDHPLTKNGLEKFMKDWENVPKA